MTTDASKTTIRGPCKKGRPNFIFCSICIHEVSGLSGIIFSFAQYTPSSPHIYANSSTFTQEFSRQHAQSRILSLHHISISAFYSITSSHLHIFFHSDTTPDSSHRVCTLQYKERHFPPVH